MSPPSRSDLPGPVDMSAERLQTKNPPLVASDLDGTLIPPRRSPEQREAVAAFAEAVRAHDLPVLYVTGRHLSHAERGIADEGLPRPDVLACDVGTSVYWAHDGSFRLDPQYRESVAAVPGVATVSHIRDAVLSAPGFRLQEAENQSDFKVSFYFDGGTDDVRVRELEERLDAGSATRFVWSRDAVKGVGLLDVLPAAVGKRTAVEHVVERLGWSRDDVVFAGDSGNDRDAFLAGWRAIVVGNTPAELREDVRAEAARSGISDSVYFAASDVAAGVVEGLQHFGMRWDL